MQNYKLVGREVVKVDTIEELIKELNPRTNPHIEGGNTYFGNVRVSTVFLMFDHNWSNQDEPILFETMVFGFGDEEQERYHTYDEAEAGHKRWCEKIERLMKLKAFL